MATIQCPLCEHQNPYKVMDLRVSDLQKEYKNLCKNDFKAEFGGHQNLTLWACEQCKLQFFQPFVVGSPDFYSNLQKNLDWYYLPHKEEYSYAKKFIRPSSKLLEIGCGEGYFSQSIPNVNYTGLEINPAVAKQAQNKNINVKFESVAQHAEKNKEAYDVVCSFQVLEHVDDLKGFINSTLKCVKHNGLIIFSVPNGESFLKHAFNIVLNMPPHHQTWWTENTFKELANHYDLKIVEIHSERLSDEHRLFYLSTKYRRKFNKILRRKEKIIDRSLVSKGINKICNLLAKVSNYKLNDVNQRPQGFALTAVMSKN
jgi:2-polyprenyl-3-methyl-5-hydroxy-6-metoxy-1,4-benzoquinol methylase